MDRNREELAWAAGFFCGEGWTSAYSVRNGVYCHFGVGQIGSAENPPDVLYRFKAALSLPDTRGKGARKGRTNFYCSRKSCYNRKPLWQYRVCGFERVQATIAMMWPWLAQAKKDQYKRVLAKLRG